MADWKQYSAIKQLIDQYWNLKEDKNYDEFIRKLAKLLNV